MNVKKTKVMCISREGGDIAKIYIKSQVVEQVKQFMFVGSFITKDGCCNQDIKSRIATEKDAFMTKKKILTSELDLELRKRSVQATMPNERCFYALQHWYTIHILKNVIKFVKKLTPWRPSWKMIATAIETQNPAWQTK